ncbi:MAG: ATP-dependent DNA helicase RecG [Chitinophagaceae bacterium]
MATAANILSHPIEYLKGVGPQRADLLKKELSIFTFNDLLHHFPYRHIDKSKILKIGELNILTEYAQVQGRLITYETVGEKTSRRLIAYLKDESGILELTWFKSISWIEKTLQKGELYLAFGRCSFYMGKPQIVHPELELVKKEVSAPKYLLEPVYSTTEKLKARGLGARQLGKMVQTLLQIVTDKDLPENLPDAIINKAKIIHRFEAYRQIHFPASYDEYEKALNRLKFEEFFITQLRLAIVKSERHRFSKGVIFHKVGDLFNIFYSQNLPFELTNAQKKVIKEIRADTASGHQMNRLLQGDVGSGKTIVALLTMLLAIDNGYQCCMMAPTEILAQQHFNSVYRLINQLPVKVHLLTGSTKVADRKQTLDFLEEGTINIVVGTHALIEEVVRFKNLGLAIVDEQHRFGVAQRAMLWKKAHVPPHVLIMTATPIPRTLAMTAYGDLDYSIMNELPPGRKPVLTVHRYDTQRNKVLEFIKTEIAEGRQAYIIFPLIEESD